MKGAKRVEVIGDATIVLGDCRQLLDTLPTVDCVVTDPPYGINFTGKATKHTPNPGKGYESTVDDEQIIVNVTVPVIEKCLARFGRLCMTPGVRNAFKYPQPDDIGGVYCPSGAGCGRWGFVCLHPIFFYGKCPALSAGRSPNSFSSTEASKPNGHPCPKPIGWMKWMVRKSTVKGETVCDPFMGSGTTGVACIQTGRKFLGIEIEPKYFEIALKRLREAWGKGTLFCDEKKHDAELFA